MSEQVKWYGREAMGERLVNMVESIIDGKSTGNYMISRDGGRIAKIGMSMKNEKVSREVIDRWVALKQKEAMADFPNDLSCAYAMLSGVLQARLGDLAMGGTARAIALEMIIEELEEGAV